MCCNNNIIITCIAPISSKRIVLNGASGTGIGQSHSQDTMQNSSTNDRTSNGFDVFVNCLIVLTVLFNFATNHSWIIYI